MSEPLIEARRARAAQAELAAQDAPPSISFAIPDPLHLCVYTTVSLLAWIFSPALVAALFAFLGLHAYVRAWRAGLRRSDCILRDPRLVMLYLGLIGAAGLGWTGWRLAAWIHAASR